MNEIATIENTRQKSNKWRWPLRLLAFQKDTPPAVITSHLYNELVATIDKTFSAWDFGNYNPDSLVQKKELKIYKQMSEDEQIKACQQVKVMARLCTAYEIKPGDEKNKQSVEMADFIRDQLSGIKGTFKAKLKDILTARTYGFSITEKIFEIIGHGKWQGKIGIKDMKTKEPFNFEFKQDRFANLLGIFKSGFFQSDKGIGTIDNPYPPHKFIIYSANKEFCNWYGQSDLKETYRSWWSKNFIMKFHNIFLERFGMPTIMASYPKELRQDKQFLEIIDDLLKNYQTKTGFRVPDGVRLELLEATRRGDAGYAEAIEMHDKKIARALLCPDLAIQAGEHGGSFALTKERFSVFILILEEIGYEIEEVVAQDQIIDPLILLNYGLVEKELRPRFCFEPLVESDTKIKSEIVDLLVRAGVVNPKEDWVRDFVNIPAKPKEIIDEEEAKQQEEERRRREEGGDEPVIMTAESPDNCCSMREKQQYLKPSVLRREPTKFESKVDFVKLNKEMDSYAEHMQEVLTEITKDWKKHIFAQAERIFKDNSLKDINKLWLRNTGSFKNELRNWMVKIHLDSKFRDAEVLKKSGVEIEIIKKDIPKKAGFTIVKFTQFPEFDPWAAMPTQAAIEFFNEKRLAKITKPNGEKKVILFGKGGELGYYDSRAFAVAGIESQYVTNQAKIILFDAVQTGDMKTAFTNLENLFGKYIDQGKISANLVSPNRLETIIRTNTNDALNRGREALFNDPDIDEFVPFVQVSAVRDERVTLYCLGLDGKVFKKSDAPGFPAHFNCRTDLIPYTIIEAEKKPPTISGLQDEEAKLRASGKPDAVRGVGFGGQPITKND